MNDELISQLKNRQRSRWVDAMLADAWREAQRLTRASKAAQSLEEYQDDPVRFGQEILHESYTDDQKRVMESVRDNMVTIAKSATEVGKSHCAARLAIWFYKVYVDAQVYLTAAPPVENLKRILWGEVMSVVDKNAALFLDDRIKVDYVLRNAQSFITRVTVPTTGTPEIREAKFCTDSDELFELTDGSLVTYKSLIGKTIDIVSVDDNFNKRLSRATFFDNGIDDVFEITLSSGIKFRRTAEHPLFVGELFVNHKKTDENHKKGNYDVKNERWDSIRYLHKNDVILSPSDTSFNFGNETMNPDEIKVLAYLIGDGCINNTNRVLFIQETNKQLNEFILCVKNLGGVVEVFNPNEYSYKVLGDGSGIFKSNKIINLLKKHDILGNDSSNKHIPEDIYKLQSGHVSLFINRLFSTDGYACVSKAGKYQKAEIGYVSKSEQLVKGIQRLLFRFGISSKITKRNASWTHNDIKKTGEYWTVSIYRSRDIISFCNKIGIYGKEDALDKCLKYAESRISYASWRYGKNGFVWDKIRSVEYIGKRHTVGVVVPKYHTYLTNIVEHNSGKHAPHILFIVDEGDAVPDEVYRGIEGCLSGGLMPRLLIMFNPRVTQGAVYEKEINKQANVITLSALNHPNVLTGKSVIPGAVMRDSVVRRFNEWTRPLMPNELITDSCVKVPDSLVGVSAWGQDGTLFPPLEEGIRVVKEDGKSFFYMVLGKYPPQGESQLISRDWIDKARERWDEYVKRNGEIPPDLRPVMGMDVAEMGGDWNVSCLRYGNFVSRLTDCWQGMDAYQTALKALEIYRKYNVDIAMIDGMGIGGSVAPTMVRIGRRNGLEVQEAWDIRAVSVKVSEKPLNFIKTEIGEFKIIRDQLWWACREWLRTEEAMLPPDRMLLEELTAVSYDIPQDGKIRITDKETLRDKIKRSPDRADALCLTFYPVRRAKTITINRPI